MNSFMYDSCTIRVRFGYIRVLLYVIVVEYISSINFLILKTTLLSVKTVY